MHDFDFLEPASVSEASRMLGDLGDDARVISGGTALMLAMRQRMLTPTHLVSLGRIPDLRGIRRDDDGTLRIGASTLHADVAASPLIRTHWPMLADMAAHVANPQVRNQGTIGGNLCYADPATDPPGCLLVLGAEVVMTSARGERVLPMADFLVDYYTTALEPDEILTEIRVPPLPDKSTGRYSRFLRTRAEHRPLVNVAVLLTLQGEVCTEARIAVGAALPVTQRLPRAEALLSGHAVTDTRVQEAADTVAADIEPLSDGRGSAEFRRDMVRVVAHRNMAGLCGLAVE